MKPLEICNNLEDGYNGKNITYMVHSKDRKMFIRKLYEDCVIAYDEAKLGSIFIIKIKGGYACFYYITTKLKSSSYSNWNINRISLKNAFEVLGDDCKIINQEEFSRVKKSIILESL